MGVVPSFQFALLLRPLKWPFQASAKHENPGTAPGSAIGGQVWTAISTVLGSLENLKMQYLGVSISKSHHASERWK